MRCEAAERELSARMDGAADPALDESLTDHLTGCSSCNRFVRGAASVRESVRLEVAEPVPEALLQGILEQVSRPATWETGRWIRRGPAWRTAGSLAAAFALGALAAALAVGGLLPRGPQAVLASDVPRRIAEASAEVTNYTATLQIVERNFRPEVPERRFRASVSFHAPERFRAVTTDLTAYPSPGWTRNNSTLEVDGATWRLDAPRTCPRQALPACSTAERDVREVQGREPFDGDTILPTDIVLPLRTLAGADRVDLAGEGRAGGRDVVKVRLDYRDADPLFAFLFAGGAWRPFYPTDTVTLSLDRQTWFPVAYEVRAEDTPQRSDWALAEGLADAPGQTIFEAAFEDLSFTEVPAGETPVLSAPRDGGFIDALPGEPRAGLVSSVPSGFTTYRTGTYREASREGEALVSFTKGLGWVKIRQTRSWSEPALFGNVGPLAAEVEIPGAGVGYYEPATDKLGRRLSIHTDDLDLYLETNLPPDELLDVAGSLGVTGVLAPSAWSVREWPGGIKREQITLEQAVGRIPYLRVPMRRPAGYEVAAVHRVEAAGAEGVTMFLRRTGMEADGVGIRLHQTPGGTLPPPVDPDVSEVRIGAIPARYSPGRSELEWVDRGIYRSVSGGSLDLGELLDMAQSMIQGAEP